MAALLSLCGVPQYSAPVNCGVPHFSATVTLWSAPAQRCCQWGGALATLKRSLAGGREELVCARGFTGSPSGQVQRRGGTPLEKAGSATCGVTQPLRVKFVSGKQ